MNTGLLVLLEYAVHKSSSLALLLHPSGLLSTYQGIVGEIFGLKVGEEEIWNIFGGNSRF